ncbi:MAG: hypothetical protein RMJ18_02065 [Candidatus Aenigmarchaeota archaeon]|nr:hypothetical protein [Candidatus Aenigmarchaeota archaeon]MDW8160181.1 hypothetical protein [Candidatus Aenigmarchaeota archaeon]
MIDGRSSMQQNKRIDVQQNKRTGAQETPVIGVLENLKEEDIKDVLLDVLLNGNFEKIYTLLFAKNNEKGNIEGVTQSQVRKFLEKGVTQSQVRKFLEIIKDIKNEKDEKIIVNKIIKALVILEYQNKRDIEGIRNIYPLYKKIFEVALELIKPKENKNQTPIITKDTKDQVFEITKNLYNLIEMLVVFFYK